MNYRGNFKSFPEGLVGFIILIAPLAMPGRTANAQQGVVTQAHATQILNSEADGKQSTEEDEICRLVIKVDFPKTDNQASSRLRADIKDGLFADYAISETRNKRLRKYPKISVPIGRNRYRVWYGYSTSIRDAVLKSASTHSGVKRKKNSAIAPVAFLEESKTVESDKATAYPHRSSWWTVAKRYPDREAMVKHLSSGQHEGTFDLDWLNSLTRDELHALHSDDHEKKINWDYAVRATESEVAATTSAK